MKNILSLSEFEKIMDEKNIEVVKDWIKKYLEFINSKEYTETLDKKQKDLLSKSVYDEFNIKNIRYSLNTLAGMACSPCANMIGAIEFIIEENGTNYFISLNWIDEVADELEIIITKDYSFWSLNYSNDLMENETSEEFKNKFKVFDDFEPFIVDRFCVSDDWLANKYAPIIVEGIKLFSDFLLKADESNTTMFFDRFLATRAWAFKNEKETELIEEIMNY